MPLKCKQFCIEQRGMGNAKKSLLAQRESQGLNLSSHLYQVKGREVECAKGKHAWCQGDDT